MGVIMPNKKIKGGAEEIVYPSGIVLGKSEFGNAFSQVVASSPQKKGAAGVDYLHISTSVVTGGYHSDPLAKVTQLARYNTIISEAAEALQHISDKIIQTGHVRKTSFTPPGGQVEERIELEIQSPEITAIIQKMEEEIKKTGLVCANKSSQVHVTIAGGQGQGATDAAEWAALENKKLSLAGASFSMVDYPPKLAGKTDFSHIDSVPDSPICSFGSAAKAAPALATSSFGELVSNPTPFSLGHNTFINKLELKVDDNSSAYYLATYSTGARARIYPDKLMNGAGTSELSQTSPLRVNINAVLGHFFTKQPAAAQVATVSTTSAAAAAAAATTCMPISPIVSAGASSSPTKHPFILHDPVGENKVVKIERDDEGKCFVLHGKNSNGDDRTLTLFDNGTMHGRGVVCEQMYNNRVEIFRHFEKELAPSHQPQQVQPK